MKRSAPEFLLIDAGNTRVKWTVAGRRWPGRIAGDIPTREASAQWVAALAHRYPTHPTVLASVVPKIVPAFRRTFAGRLAEVGSRMPAAGFGKNFRFAYPNPAELGADRIAAAIAAHAWGQYPAIIVACGTATAFTVLDARGRLCGGAIAPGLQAQLDALIAHTSQLPATKLRPVRSALGRSTRDAIRAGVLLNFQGGVKEIIHQLTKTLPGRRKPHLLVTGGNASYLAGKLDVPFTLRPLLVFEGLLMIAFRCFTSAP